MHVTTTVWGSLHQTTESTKAYTERMHHAGATTYWRTTSSVVGYGQPKQCIDEHLSACVQLVWRITELLGLYKYQMGIIVCNQNAHVYFTESRFRPNPTHCQQSSIHSSILPIQYPIPQLSIYPIPPAFSAQPQYQPTYPL